MRAEQRQTLPSWNAGGTIHENRASASRSRRWHDRQIMSGCPGRSGDGSPLQRETSVGSIYAASSATSICPQNMRTVSIRGFFVSPSRIFSSV